MEQDNSIYRYKMVTKEVISKYRESQNRNHKPQYSPKSIRVTVRGTFKVSVFHI